ncbi:signal recognition particle-docking protein FtsY [Nakamurella sp. YIM 132084]|uniref:Signal recognition particle receptor FtsY n=1 Tax=Nakamurella leprariae TaxID=2803911 RepID=A0A939BVU7_9ACTN|nr:signal recognition particle-docking protein FtsY [Nakamurella leprariae]
MLAVVFAIGLARSKRRTVSLRDAPPVTPGKQEPDQPPARGGYRTSGSSISFSEGPSAGGATGLLDRPPPPREPEPVTPPVTPPAVPTAPVAPPPVAPPVEPEPAAAHPVTDRPEVDGQPGVGDDASVPRDAPSRSILEVELPDAPVEAPVAEPEPREQIEPAEGRLTRLRGRLSRSQTTFGRSLLGLLGAGTLDEDSWTDVEDTLLLADLGAAAAAEITERLRQEVAAHGVTDAASARAMLRRVLIDAVSMSTPDGLVDRSVRALPHDGRPSVVLVVGVNGTGKTTTTGKLARVLVAGGRSVVLGAADTFRAAAADQLQTWGERAGAAVVRSKEGTDPASVAFDAVKRGISDGVDAVLIDTAGRLHTKTGLMDELGKVKRVIEKQAEVDEVLLVLDATTGQNGLVQASVFAEVVDITGIVLTKLDGTARGGIVVAVQRSLGVPVKLVGLGEGPDDLAPFEPAAFVDALLGD